MISVRRIQLGESELFKQMRLTSLHESPSAFASTYESAPQRSPESWCQQADSTAQRSDRSTFIAFSGNSPIGIAALYYQKYGFKPANGISIDVPDDSVVLMKEIEV